MHLESFSKGKKLLLVLKLFPTSNEMHPCAIAYLTIVFCLKKLTA